MPTKTLALEPIYSGNSVLHMEYPGVKYRSTTFINALTSTLVEAGWTVQADPATKATGSISYPLGLPVLIPHGPVTLTPLGCGQPFVVLGNQGYVGYDPTSSTPSGTCQYFSWGNTSADSAANLAAKITATSIFDATVVGTTVVLIAKLPGPEPNFTYCRGDGTFGVGATPVGGGYTLLSGSLTDTTQYSVTITGVRPDNRGDGSPQVAINGLSTYITDLAVSDGPINSFTMLANPAGFCYFADRDNYFLKNTSLYVAAPQTTALHDALAYRFSIDPGYFRKNTQWTSGSGNANGTYQVYGLSGTCPQLMALRAPGPTPMVTIGNKPIATRAWIEGTALNSQAVRVLGCLWDGVNITDYVTTGVVIGTKQHIPISSQTGSTTDPNDTGGNDQSTRVSYLWGYDRVV